MEYLVLKANFKGTSKVNQLAPATSKLKLACLKALNKRSDWCESKLKCAHYRAADYS